MTPEGKVLAYAKRQARLLGLLPLRFSTRSGVQVGWPDLIILRMGQPGAAMFLEVKAAGGKPSSVQGARIDHLRRFGFDARVAVGNAEVDAALLEFARG